MEEPSVWLLASVELRAAMDPAAAKGSDAMKERRRKGIS
jgi:hypothetical protein